MVNAEHLYKMVILEHAKNQGHLGTLTGEDVFQVQERNNSCGDDLAMFVKIENNKIQDLAYQIKGCILSKAASSMIADQVKGKEIFEVKQILADFSKMMQGELKSSKTLGEELPILHEVVKFPVRIKCVTLPFKVLERIITEVE